MMKNFGSVKCVICGEIFDRYNWNTVYCSDKCRKIKDNRVHRKKYWDNPDVSRELDKLWYSRRKQGIDPPKQIVICKICKNEFKQNTHNHIFCSRYCENISNQEKEKLWRIEHPDEAKTVDHNRYCERRDMNVAYATTRYYLLRDDPEFLEKKKLSNKKYLSTDLGHETKKKSWILRHKNTQKVIHLFTDDELKEKLKSVGNICPRCGCNINDGKKLTTDHIYPISKANPGRIYTLDDMQIICKSCNSSKGDRIDID